MALACAADPGDPLKTSAAYQGSEAGKAANDASFDGSSTGSSGSSGSSSGSGSGSGSSGSSSSGGPVDASGEASNDGNSDGSSGALVDAAIDTYTPPSCPTCPLKVEYFSNNPTETTTGEIHFYLDITNSGAMAQDLTQITMRYWFTADGSQSQTFVCDYAKLATPCPVTGTFAKLSTPTTNADTYLEMKFASGSIAPQGDTGVFQGRFHDTTYAVMMNQGNDYSFDPTKTPTTCGASNSTPSCPWDHITLYRQGMLVWGIEPGGAAAGGDAGATFDAASDALGD